MSFRNQLFSRVFYSVVKITLKLHDGVGVGRNEGVEVGFSDGDTQNQICDI